MKRLFDIEHLQHIDDYPIESRERELLHYIDNHGFLTTKALRAIIKDKKQAYQLMRVLLEKQYVLTSQVYGERSSIWYLSDIGKTFRRIRNPYYLDMVDFDHCERINGKIKLSTKHTTYCTLIEIKLRELAQHHDISRIVSDRYLHKHFQQFYKEILYFTGGTLRVADGEFYLDDKAIAFEVELTQKKEARYRKIYDFFMEYTRYEKVIWFYTDEKIRDKVQAYFLKFYEEDFPKLSAFSEGRKKLERCRGLHVFLEVNEFLDNGLL